jgi:hypothetical protein
VRLELLMSMKGAAESTIDEIVDDIWMPLLRARGALR